MGERPTNEYLSSIRAENDENDLFAAIGKQVLNLSLGDEEKELPEDERVKIVDEIDDTLCMSCGKDVSRLTPR